MDRWIDSWTERETVCQIWILQSSNITLLLVYL